MITIICATHRPQNQTLKVVSAYEELLKQQGCDTAVFRLDELPDDFIISDVFGNRSDVVQQIMDEKIVPAEKVVIIAPEYHGSYPGIFKVFLDGAPRELLRGKKAALVGVATGRAGNLRGIDHLTDVLHHMRVEVFSNKVPISRLDELLGDTDELVDENTLKVLKTQIQEFLKF